MSSLNTVYDLSSGAPDGPRGQTALKVESEFSGFWGPLGPWALPGTSSDATGCESPVKHVHVNEAILRQILDRGEDPLAMRLLLHQTTTCELCAHRLGFLVELFRTGALTDDCTFNGLDVFLGWSRLQAEALWNEIETLPESSWESRIQSDDRFRSWGLCEFLCDKSRALAGQNPERASTVAQLAVSLSKVATCRYVPDRLRPELEMLAYAHLGNALRALDELKLAQDHFEKAEECWWKSEDDFLDYRPRVMTLRASLHIEERRFPQALEAIQEALVLNRDQSSPKADLEANALILKSIVLVETDRVEEAVGVLDQAVRAIDPKKHPVLWLAARHNQIDYLTRLGNFEEAGQRLPEVEALALEQGFDIVALRNEWCKARISGGSGDIDGAIERFDRVRQDFLNRGLGYNAAIVSLELATVYMKQGGQTDQVKRLAAGMLPIFQSQDIHREALAALAVFQKATALDKLSGQLLGDLIRYMHKARMNPSLHFSAEL